MNCPVDGTELRMTERQGVEIDYCPRCRGVWLDRGELDKIVERAAPPPGYDDDDDWDDDDRHERGERHQRRGSSEYGEHRKKGFWGRLFDID